MANRLGRDFYVRSAESVAKELLGKYITVNEVSGKIIETEAYIGPQDRASHAFGRKITERNKVEYLIGGHVYIYLVYGMYWQLNIVTNGEGFPGCVLIRALDMGTEEIKKSNGPGKLCNCLGLDKSFYGEDLTQSRRVWLENKGSERVKIKSGPRIGIDYAGPYWAKRKLRFYIEDYKMFLP
ncbi:MAG: DNA-3-methyladenine glycosylase [bacterium]|nr:DNA-3-methyladenine glycosylase [bacterium]